CPGCSADEFDRVLAVNVTGSYVMLRATAARMTPQQVGRIVNISSITAFDGGGTYSKGVYAIAKAVVVGMCRGGAGELGSYGITVNVIAPVQVSAVKAALTAPRAHGGAVRGRPHCQGEPPADPAPRLGSRRRRLSAAADPGCAASPQSQAHGGRRTRGRTPTTPDSPHR
ncbi:MAG: SDR family oxidoreductase, partial [Dermatophilaceae bacterium]